MTGDDEAAAPASGPLLDPAAFARVPGQVDTGDHGAHARGIFDVELLDRCISCGFCLPVCPTYALDKDEQSSPRGRITLMRALESGRLEPDDPVLQHEASYCLGCRACETVCPAGVEYGPMLEQWRDHQWRAGHGPRLARWLRWAVERRAMLRLSGLVRRFARTRGPVSDASPHVMLGCAERALFPSVSRAAVSLVPGADAPAEQGCCGALHAHNGDSAGGRAMAERLGQDLPGTIVTTSGGCAAHVAEHLGRDRVAEISDYLTRTGWAPAGRLMTTGADGKPRPVRVSLQDSCHLRNGLGVSGQPRELLERIAEYVEAPSAASCCGAAGSYSMLRPRDSKRVLAPKLDEIEQLGVDYVVAVNPGCLLQLKQGLLARRSRVKAVHLVELLIRAA
ncbi:glycolate oxidase iron-sulfur subunit [Haloactinopolyspora alba]|uniref:Glycolate oxidase iron-sulfur subunit n=1 Tax=Haloactinopolyspora alba TaxID=648780 RepID=A0A2P8EB42_9ACTN|nr:(Fe-S)-binding protein [Haloactinopolyspora alba]PSL06685.1 glycolate oxidase iron-sulfur subunit [Haloactinopolyspora alba]